MQESGPSAQTMLKRTGIVVYTAMVASIAKPPGWVKEILLLRFVEKAGASTVFIITGEALAQFRQCELSKIYEVEVPGRAVRSSSGSTKYGVKCRFEVHMQYPPKNLRLSKLTFPTPSLYDFHDWAKLDALPEGSIVDLIGVGVTAPRRRDSGGLAKATVCIRSGHYSEDIVILRAFAEIPTSPQAILLPWLG